jgi:hypothetical protein
VVGVSEDTISVPGMGEVTSPSELSAQNSSKYETEYVPVPSNCPVPGCPSSGYSTFAELRGHFGNKNDAAHRSYELDIDDYRSDDA